MSDLFILKELRKRFLDLHILKDMRAKAHTGRIVISLRFGARKKAKVGAMESGAIFYTGSVKKNRSKVNKKARGLGSPRSELYTVRYSLEDDLRRELQIEGFPRADPRSPVEVANGIANGAVTVDGTGARREIDAVE